MRARHFRPGFDRLDLRITPSSGSVYSAGPPPSSGPGGYVSTANDPGLTDDGGTTEYCSGSESGYNPLNPTVAAN